MKDNIKDIINIPSQLDDAVYRGIERGRKEKKLKKVKNNKKLIYKVASIITISILGVATLGPVAVKAITDFKIYIEKSTNNMFDEPLADNLLKNGVSDKLVSKDKNATITLENTMMDGNTFVAQFIIESDFFKQYDEYGLLHSLDMNSTLKLNGEENLISMYSGIEKIDDTTSIGTIKGDIEESNIGDEVKVSININSIVIRDLKWKSNNIKEIQGNWQFDTTVEKIKNIKEIDVNKSIKVGKEEMGIEKVIISPIGNYVSLKHRVVDTIQDSLWHAIYKVVDNNGNTYRNGGFVQEDGYGNHTGKLKIFGDLSNAEYVDITPYWESGYIHRDVEGLKYREILLTTTGDESSEREEILYKRPVGEKELNIDTKPYGKYKLNNINYFLDIDKSRLFFPIKDLIGQDIKVSPTSKVTVKDIKTTDNKTKVMLKVDGDYGGLNRIVMFDEDMNDTYSGMYTDVGLIVGGKGEGEGGIGSGIYTFILDEIDPTKKYKIAIPMETSPKINKNYTIRVNLK